MSKRRVVGGIDYSKWDHLEDSDSDQECLVGTTAIQPRVTRLDAPSRITTTPDGTLLVETTETQTQARSDQPQEQSSGPASAIVTSSPKTASIGTGTATASIPRTARMEDDTTKPSAAQEGSTRCTTSSTTTTVPTTTCEADASWTTNGGHVPSHGLYWSQDRTTVMLRFRLPTNAVPKAISVQWKGTIYSYKDRHSAVGTNNTASFQIVWNNSQDNNTQEVLVHGDLPHPIHYNERDNDYDEDGDDELDWEIDHDKEGRKYVLLTLPKAVPMAGVTLRWSRPMQQVRVVVDDGGSTTITRTDNPFQKAWDEAHTMFRDKMARGEIPKHPASVVSPDAE